MIQTVNTYQKIGIPLKKLKNYLNVTFSKFKNKNNLNSLRILKYNH